MTTTQPDSLLRFDARDHDGRQIDVYVHRGDTDTSLTVSGQPPIVFSRAAAERLARMLSPGVADSPAGPEPAEPSEPDEAPAVARRRVWTETVQDLCQEGFLPAETLLCMTLRGERHVAEITDAGRIAVGGRPFDTPSAAGAHVKGGAINGWDCWSVAAHPVNSRLVGETLADLRWRLRARRFPPAAYRADEDRAVLLQLEAEGWVGWCVKDDHAPDWNTEVAVKAYLASSGGREPGHDDRRRACLDIWFQHLSR